jgi:serine/threonine protein kinase
VQVADPVTPGPFAAVPGDDSPTGDPSDDEVDEAFSRIGERVSEPVSPPAPPADVGTGARLSITDPGIPGGPGLDLASVAESAIEERAREPVPPRPARVAAHVPSWRDDRFGPYELLDRVAIGGMAEVFKAKRTGVEGFEKTVALKRILPHLSENKEFLDMFVDEAKMVAGLAHPNIVQIFDLGRIEKSYYIAMEYLHGRDLRTIMRRAREKGLRMPLDLSLRVVSQVCAALEYAHRKKDARGRPMEIVHRDVSPQNILISFEGDVKLVDFGIAKAATKASNTDRGALRGKLLYMSPEQAWGRPIDRRSDVFSLGIVLYEMVTGTKPFLGAGTELTILELVRQCVIASAREINPRVPEALDRVIMEALARDPDERYQDAGQMQRGLERFLRERPPVTARDLARFLELLFDRHEREEAGDERRPSPDHAPDPMSLDSLLKRFGIDE